MKKFITLIGYCLLLVAAILILIKFALINYGRIDRNQNIILGDSHIEFVDAEGLANFSTGGASMKTLFMSIQMINVKNKKVFISIGPHTFADFRTSRYSDKNKYKEWIYTMDTLIPKRLNIYHTWWKLPNSGKELFRIAKLYSPKPIYDVETNLTDTLLDRTVSRHYPNECINDTTERKWFDKIISYVHKNGGKVFLIEMPIHEDYLKRIPTKYLVRYDSITSRFENVIRFNHPPDSLFRDGDHILPKYQSEFLARGIN